MMESIQIEYDLHMNLRKKIAPIIFGLVAINCFAYDGPMIDGHAHWGDSFNEEAVLDRYAKSGVVAQIVMPRYLGLQGDWPTTDERVLEIAARHPNKLFVLAGMQRPDFTYMNWNKPDSNSQTILKEIDKKLEEKKVYGIGEVLVRHWAYANEGRIGQHAEIDKRFDTVFIRQIAAIAIKHQVPVVIHMEGYPELVKELDTVLKEQSNLRLVWAHGCGRSGPEIIRSLLVSHPNLYCDLSNMTNTGGYGSGWPRAENFTHQFEAKGIFHEPYKKLILDFPDRFFVGMDVAHQSRWTMENGNTFERRVNRTRELLGTLPEPVAKKLAYENVIAVFKLPKALISN
jgi:Tat protein secretion system quality control protein TatD with DNase activity